MTKFEFEDITGLKVTEEEYKEIEKMYYAVPNMDKHEFCKRWRQTGNNPLTVELAKQATIANGMLEERTNFSPNASCTRSLEQRKIPIATQPNTQKLARFNV